MDTRTSKRSVIRCIDGCQHRAEYQYVFASTTFRRDVFAPRTSKLRWAASRAVPVRDAGALAIALSASKRAGPPRARAGVSQTRPVRPPFRCVHDPSWRAGKRRRLFCRPRCQPGSGIRSMLRRPVVAFSTPCREFHSAGGMAPREVRRADSRCDASPQRIDSVGGTGTICAASRCARRRPRLCRARCHRLRRLGNLRFFIVTVSDN